jgi:transcription initiation factor IIE alpha subunit
VAGSRKTRVTNRGGHAKHVGAAKTNRRVAKKAPRAAARRGVKTQKRGGPAAKTRDYARRQKAVRAAAARHPVHVKAIAPKKGEAKVRTRVNVSIPEQADAKRAIDNLLVNEEVVEYLKKNVSKRAVDVINMLATPETDENLAEQLGMKINAIRRILNIMQGYGITNYYVSKNTNGWLSFSWYINANKVAPFLEYIGSMGDNKVAADENCNDYFICNNCYKNDKFIYTFDAAFETEFKCSCGNNLERIEREQVEALLNKKPADSKQDLV